MSKYGNEVQVGDVMTFFGKSHRVVKIEPYSPPAFPGEAWRIATWENGEGITLEPTVQFEVA